MKNYMGIDIGTTGGRACIFDENGNLVGKAYCEYPSHYPQPTWVEQYAEEILPVLFQVCNDAIKSSPVTAEDIQAVAISSYSPVICLLDKDYNLLTPLIGWQDTRGLKYFMEAVGSVGNPAEYYGITGGPLAPTNPIAKFLWLKHEMPEEWEKAAYLADALSYFNLKFGAGELAIDTAAASRLMIMDIDNLRYSQTVCDRLGIDISKLPAIVEPGTLLGTISDEIAEKTGLAKRTKLVMGTLDQNASSLGMGLINPGQAGFTLGTAGLVTIITEKSSRHPGGCLMAKRNAGKNNFTLEGISFAAAASYKWYRDVFCLSEKEAAEKIGVDAYDIMNQLARLSKPGANGVTFLNFLQGAAGVIGNFSARGVFSGMTLSTTKADMTRAVMEGIVYEAKTIVNEIKDMGLNIDEMRLSGGGAKSRTWCQMQADIFGIPIILLQSSELTALGAAMLAAVGAGRFADIDEAVTNCVHIQKTYEPDPSNKDAYEDGYQRFIDCYNALAVSIWKQ